MKNASLKYIDNLFRKMIMKNKIFLRTKNLRNRKLKTRVLLLYLKIKKQINTLI